MRGSANRASFATFEVSVLAFACAAEGMIPRGLSQHRAGGLRHDMAWFSDLQGRLIATAIFVIGWKN